MAQKQVYDENNIEFHRKMMVLSDLARINKKFSVSSMYNGIYAKDFKSRNLINEDGTLTECGYQMVEHYDISQKNRAIFQSTKSPEKLIPLW